MILDSAASKMQICYEEKHFLTFYFIFFLEIDKHQLKMTTVADPSLEQDRLGNLCRKMRVEQSAVCDLSKKTDKRK